MFNVSLGFAAWLRQECSMFNVGNVPMYHVPGGVGLKGFRGGYEKLPDCFKENHISQ
jgi:hypothetical protein